MQFSKIALSIVFGSALVAAIPQATTAIESTTVTTGAPASTVSVDSAQASTYACIKACNPGDVYCQAKCENIPTPDGTAVNATYDCTAACPKGSGSDADNAAWAQCQQACISSYYLTASTSYTAYLPPVATYTRTFDTTTETQTIGLGASTTSSAQEASAQSTASGTDTGSAATGTGTESPTSSASAKATGNAGVAITMNMPVAGVLGLFLAALAL